MKNIRPLGYFSGFPCYLSGYIHKGTCVHFSSHGMCIALLQVHAHRPLTPLYVVFSCTIE